MRSHIVTPVACVSGALMLLVGCALPHRRQEDLASGTSDASVIWQETFETVHSPRWREVSLKGHTHYQTLILDERRCLQAQSHSAASICVSRTTLAAVKPQ